ncbi:hypothetical protein DOTSEDRAFT_28975 [Dothistroma septosporum NZE10]|uniref:Uncharacterized protein n=1 Tax=Dothistroma septosporum (strain NZE10 / CBS 128990) TaxID=675120 RepID=M2XH20_DOTSN|nr:hypothetical protein DOTSEDRAFT_28975 [Dothistroma septosporum NZE10]
MGREDPSQRYEAALLRDAKVSIIRVLDKDRLSDSAGLRSETFSKDFLKSLLLYGPNLDIDFLAASLAADQLAQDSGPLIAGLPRSPHSATTLLSLIALTKDVRLMKHIATAWLHAHGILTTKQHLLELCPEKSSLIHFSSKHCRSPACIELFQASHTIGILPPSPWTSALLFQPPCPAGSTRSSEFTLPPFVSRSLGTTVVECVARQAAKRLREWQDALRYKHHKETLQPMVKAAREKELRDQESYAVA